MKVWLDGVEVLSRSDVKYRGNVSDGTALVDTFLRSTFYGGADDTWAPSKETSIRFGDFEVYAGAPDGVSSAPSVQQPPASVSPTGSQPQTTISTPSPPPPSSATPATMACTYHSRSPVNNDGGDCGDACRQQLKDAARAIGITNFPNNLSDRSVARDFYNRIRTEGAQKECDPLKDTVYVK